MKKQGQCVYVWFLECCRVVCSYNIIWLSFTASSDGFPSVSEVVESSLVLSRYTNHSAAIGHWLLFPKLTFSCDCSLTGWTFIVSGANRESTNSLDHLLQFQIWRRLSNIILTQVSSIQISKSNISRVLQTNEKMGMSLVEIDLNEPIQVEEGDMFGVFQPSSSRSELVLQFQSELAPAHYVRLTNTPSVSYSLRGSLVNYDYPLISIKYGKCTLFVLYFSRFGYFGNACIQWWSCNLFRSKQSLKICCT